MAIFCADSHNIITEQTLMIHFAVLNDCPEGVKLILDAGADPNYHYQELLQENG
jgi:hypothetical protein